MSYFIHPTSIVDDDVVIGANTRIWHFCHLMPGCSIGTNCNIGQNVMIGTGVSIGNNVKIQNNVSVYPAVTIEDDVFLGPSMVFTNVINPRSRVDRKHEYKPTVVRRGATIGANATIVCGVELGQYCFIGAGSVVTKPVKPFALMVGNPARQIGWVSKNGLKLRFEDGKGTCPETGEHYLLKGGEVFPNPIQE